MSQAKNFSGDFLQNHKNYVNIVAISSWLVFSNESS
jgi:hypothetical protein